jgi:hypothetical protein
MINSINTFLSVSGIHPAQIAPCILLPTSVPDDKINPHKAEQLRFSPYDEPFGAYTAHLFFIPHVTSTLGITGCGLLCGFIFYVLFFPIKQNTIIDFPTKSQKIF